MSVKLKGIDVSKYQGSIDWARVKKAGVKFAVIRCGYANHDGSITRDPRFDEYMRGAAAAGVACGVYVYSYVESEAAARRAAQNVLDMVKGYSVAYPLAWDYEHATLYKKYSRAQNAGICRAALETWEQAGWYAILYTYKSFAGAYLNMSGLAAYDFWLAHYTDKTNYSSPYGMWQYTSSGSVDGIAGRVDMDWAYKDYAAIIKKAGLNGYAKDESAETDQKPAQKRMQVIKIGPVTEGDAAKIKSLCDSLNITNTGLYSSEYAE